MDECREGIRLIIGDCGPRPGRPVVGLDGQHVEGKAVRVAGADKFPILHECFCVIGGICKVSRCKRVEGQSAVGPFGLFRKKIGECRAFRIGALRHLSSVSGADCLPSAVREVAGKPVGPSIIVVDGIGQGVCGGDHTNGEVIGLLIAP
ncbi:hypothetical protein SDC9_101404 [bioreactor metagenome]|uniref:Uncharacterized protein n=1 Tax=bioreactor metagenome TaxID=1076179 RepID=A0A645AN22_9ZZZZ